MQRLLLVDDDAVFLRVMGRALERRGFEVHAVATADQVVAVARRVSPTHAVIDLRLAERSGMQLIRPLLALDPAMRIVMLSGYASLATAIDAVKLGAIYYLPKPTDADAVVAAFERTEPQPEVPESTTPVSLERLQWEQIQRVLNDTGGNISAAARRLGMHRRTLQRRLAKRAPVKHPGDCT